MTTEATTSLASRLRSLRQERGWSQAELGHETGVDQPEISRYESGARMPSVPTLRRLARALDVTLDELAGE